MNQTQPQPYNMPAVEVSPSRYLRQVTLTLPASINRAALTELLTKSGAEPTITVRLPYGTQYIDVVDLAHREGLLIDHNHGDIRLVKPQRRPLLQTLKQFFVQPQAF